VTESASTVHPFWRAVVGAGLGLTIGLVCVFKGFWAAVLVAILIILGGIAGVLLISGD
jgi:uncharacterized membrane protein